MKALISATGEGSRLRPLTADSSKPMQSVGGVPQLERIVSLLKRHGITEIAINLHHKPWAVVHHLGIGRRWGVHIHYSFEETLLGSAGAAKRLEWYLDESFIVFESDVYTEMDLSGLIEAHRQGGALVTMTLFTVDNPEKRGIVELDAASRVRRIVEKPPPTQISSRLVNAGIFVVEPEILSWLTADQHVDLRYDVFSRILASGLPVIGYPATEILNHTDTSNDFQKPQQLATEHVALRAKMHYTPHNISQLNQKALPQVAFSGSDEPSAVDQPGA